MSKIKRTVMSALVACFGIFGVASVAGAEATPTSVDLELGGIFESATDLATDSLLDVLPYAGIILGVFVAIRVAMRIYRAVAGG